MVSRQRRRRTFPLTTWAGARRAERSWDSARRSARDYQRAAKYFDLRNFPAEAAENLGPRLARHLKIVLDQQLPIDGDSMSDHPTGHHEDGLPPDVEQVGRLETPGMPVNMRLQRVPRPDGVLIWQLSAASVAVIPDLYARYGYGRLERQPCRACSSRQVARYPALAVVGPRAPRQDGLRPWAAGHYPGAPAAAATSERADRGAEHIRGETGAATDPRALPGPVASALAVLRDRQPPARRPGADHADRRVGLDDSARRGIR